MADPREQQKENKAEETGKPRSDSELSDADVEDVAGGGCKQNTQVNVNTNVCGGGGVRG